MPVNYNLSAQPWLKPADPTAAYAKGFGLGNQAGQAQAQIAMERARLQEANNRTAVEIALKQEPSAASQARSDLSSLADRRISKFDDVIKAREVTRFVCPFKVRSNK